MIVWITAAYGRATAVLYINNFQEDERFKFEEFPDKLWTGMIWRDSGVFLSWLF
jgi:hypothetical protein